MELVSIGVSVRLPQIRVDRAIKVATRHRFAILGLCIGALMSCDLYSERRVLPGGYRLERFDDDTFFIEYGVSTTEPGGVLEGAITELGWNEDVIVAKRTATAGGAREWLVIDARTRARAGPFNDSQWSEVRRTRPELERVEIRSVKEAWAHLK